MAVNKDEINAANEKALTQVSKKVHKLGNDHVIKASSEARSIFNHVIGALVCRNCGSTNPPILLDVENASCLSCGASQEITIFVGPQTPPTIDEIIPDSEVAPVTTDVELTEAKPANG